ncbi:aminopeptidase N-like [Bacillus rossius redtenbacheri]|uniref:aminopeptidase N-like n=1 Tax=Bacillus rossius redtenbacheri TaxID=93214 RepID=UPI002FDE61DA
MHQTTLSRMLPSAAVLLAAAVACTAATPRKWALPADPALLAASADDPSYRLPSDLRPLHYDLSLRPNLAGDFQFHGSVAVALRVLAATPNVTLHAEDLEVEGDSVSVTTSGAEGEGEEVEVTTRSRDEDRSFYTVTLDSPLKLNGEYTLRMNYTGHHRDSMRGFYRSSYLDQDNNTVWLATTHFEPTAARRAFPCFDEPALKATFRVSIAAPPGLRAISNTPVASLQPEEESGHTWYHFERTPMPMSTYLSGHTWYHFERTPMPMSTYLVAFVVSAFENTTSADGFASVWLQPGLESQGRFSAELGPKVIRAMENFTQVPYFLPKMDEVAVPDLSDNGMENYAIVTFRERVVLFEEGESSTSDKQETATVVAHEFGHQWFGDLVGPRWWTYIWLNEGFATYFQYFGAAMVEPSWRLDEQFVVDQVHDAFSTDAYASHPMTLEHVSPADITRAFDSVSYAKSGAVIRMIEHVMTHDTFRKGLTHYLKANGNDTARDQDLFDSLVEQYYKDFPNSRVDLQDFLVSWVRQTGFPIITVTRNYTEGTVKVSQERFKTGAQDTSTAGSNQTWWVPLTYATKSHPDFNSTSPVDWLTRNDSEKLLEGLTVADGDWVIFNVHQTGFYRVSYDEANWRLLARQLDSDQFEVIPAVNRAQILNDAFALAEEGRLDYGLVVGLLRYLPRETDYIPWAAALQCVTTLNDKVKGSPDYSVFQDFVLGLLKPSYDALGFDEKPSDDHVTKLLRTQVVQWACDLGHGPCVQTAVSKFRVFMGDPEGSRVEPDVRRTVYCYGLQAGSYDDYAALWRRYLTTKVATERMLLLQMLVCAGDETAAHEYFMNIRTNHTGIKEQDVSYITGWIYSSNTAIENYISFLDKHFDDITKYENSSTAVLGEVVTLSSFIWTKDQYNKLRRLLESHSAQLHLGGGADDYLSLARADMEAAAALGRRVAAAIRGLAPGPA